MVQDVYIATLGKDVRRVEGCNITRHAREVGLKRESREKAGIKIFQQVHAATPADKSSVWYDFSSAITI